MITEEIPFHELTAENPVAPLLLMIYASLAAGDTVSVQNAVMQLLKAGPLAQKGFNQEQYDAILDTVHAMQEWQKNQVDDADPPSQIQVVHDFPVQ